MALQVTDVLVQQAELLGELLEDGQEIKVADGGAGGLGNAAFGSKPWGPASARRTKGKEVGCCRQIDIHHTH